MEQKWLKMFPSPSRAKPERKLSIGDDGSGGDSTASVDVGSDRRMRGATPAQTWLSRVVRGPADGNSTGARESPAKEGHPHCGRDIWETSDEEPRDALSRGEHGQAVERKRYDGRGLASSVADGGDRLQMLVVSRCDGYDHRRHHSVEIGTGGSTHPNGRLGVTSGSWTPSSSHRSQYMQGGTSPLEPVAYPRGQHHGNTRGPPAGPSLWQRAKAEKIPSGIAVRCDRDAKPYPVLSRRRGGGGEVAAAVQSAANESAAAVDGGDEVSRASRSGWAQAQETRPHQWRASQLLRKPLGREGERARENTQERRREKIRAPMGDAPAGGGPVAWREHGLGRHVSAADEAYTGPFLHHESEQQRAASGSYTRRHGDSGDREGRGYGRRSPAEAAFGRTPFRVKPEPAAPPPPLRADNHRKALYPGSEQAPEPGRCLPQTSYMVGPPPERSLRRHHTSWQFSGGQHHYYHSVKDERRAWVDGLTAGLDGHGPAKKLRVIGSFSHAGAGGGSGGRSGDDRPMHPRYQQHQHQHQHRHKQQRRHPGMASAIYCQPGRTGVNGDGNARAATEAFSPASLSNPMRGDATPPRRSPSRDCFLRVSASPVSTVVPSIEYAPIVVPRRVLVQPFWPF